MVAVAWDVFAVSETQRHWSNALASTRMVLFVVAHELAQPLARVFEPGRTIANFTMRRTRQDRSRALPPTGVY